MIARLRVGVPVLYGGTWMAGVSYVEHLARAVAVLPEDERPQLFLIIADGTPESAERVRHMVPCFKGILFIGQNPDQAVRVFGTRGFEYVHVDDLTERVDCVFPGYPELGLPNGIPWIPDLQHKLVPEFCSDEDRAKRDREFAEMVGHAGPVVVSSRASARDIRQFYPDSPADLRVLPFHALPSPTWYEQDPADVQRRYGLPDAFAICCNQFWAHKNHRRLFEAVAILRARGTPLPLVCTGLTHDYRNPGFYGEMEKRIAELGVADLVHVLGFLPRADQIQLLRRALFVVQPSLFEGWNTGVEDGRALGKTMVLSDLDVHREQAPRYGVFFDRNSPEELATKMAGLLPKTKPGPDRRRERRAAAEAQHLAERYARRFCLILMEARAGMNRAAESRRAVPERRLQERIAGLEAMSAELLKAYVRSRFRRLIEQAGPQTRLALFGNGRHTAWLLETLDSLSPRPTIAVILDERAAGAESTRGIPVCTPQPDAIRDIDIVIPSSDVYESLFVDRIRERLGDAVRVWRLYDDLRPGPYPK
ncbi:MAG: glycosyltransferase family 4 protein [Kiritimatiellae bacterium]|nr:glycosyltransferase family 4 protein [Kiritimatiellia bacterium]